MRIIYFLALSLLPSVIADEFDELKSPEENPLEERETLFQIEHSLDGDTFVSRGNFLVVATNENAIIKFDKPHMMQQKELRQFEQLVSRDGFYRIRVRSIAGDRSSPFALASIKACQLQMARFTEQISFHLDANSHIASIEYSNPYLGECDETNMSRVRLPKKKSVKMRSSGVSLLPIEAHSLPHIVKGNIFVKSSGIDGKAGKKAEEAAKQSPSFLRKYWYIFVPMGILFVLSNAVDPEALAEAQAKAKQS